MSTELANFNNFADERVELPDTVTGAVFALWFAHRYGLVGRHVDVLHQCKTRVGAWDSLKDLAEPRVLLVRDHREDTWPEWFANLF